MPRRGLTVGELRELIEDMDDEVEVRILVQPNYPLESTCSAVSKNEVDEDYENVGKEGDILYIVERSQKGYGSKRYFG